MQNKIKDYGRKSYKRLSQQLPKTSDTPWQLVCKLPYNCHFQPSIELESPTESQGAFNSSNPLVLYLTPTETFTITRGKQTIEAKNWVSGEGAVYTIPAGVTVRSVQYRETGYDTTFAGSFHCNDDDFNILWKKAARTAYICMRDHFYDCPDRERVGFWGDGTPELNQCFYVFDTNAHALAKDLVVRKLEPKFYPGQHLEFLGEYGLWFYFLQTGDVESLRKVYEPTKVFLFETYLFGKQTWFDWGKEVKDIAVIETCFYYNCLTTLKKIAILIGRTSDIGKITDRITDIEKTFDQKYWRGRYYQSSQVETPDDRANAMAINVGLADPKNWDTIYTDVLQVKEYSSCFFDRWVFEALIKIGKEEAALLRMYRRYKTMIPCSFTTLWEHYDRWWASNIDAFDDASSLNHGWNPPALILSQRIAGVAPIEPAWKTYEILPKEAFLTDITVVVPTVKGDIHVSIKKTRENYTIQLTSPAETVATVGIPKRVFNSIKNVRVAGTILWDGQFRSEHPGVAHQGETQDYIMFAFQPGTWTLRATGMIHLASPKVPARKTKAETPLEKRDWTASASVPDANFLFSGDKIPIATPAANALDGDAWTGWRDMTQTQYPGQWFQVNLKQKTRFSKLVLDNTWALWDSPVAFAVTVSNDGLGWSQPIAVGAGKLGITTITFARQFAQFVRITQTGSSTNYNWSIYELDLFS